MTTSGTSQVRDAKSYWPRRRVDQALVCLCLVVASFAILQLLLFPFGRDQGIFATIGSGLLNGKMLYRDLWDVKTPGIFFIYAFAELVFGHTMVATRIVESLVLLTTLVMLVELGRRWFDDLFAGYLGAAVLAIVHFQLDFWHTGQPETYGGMFLLWSAWILSGSRPRTSWVRYLIAGTLIGVVALLKPHSVLAAPLLVWGALSWHGDKSVGKPMLVVLSAFSLVLLACFAWLVYAGAWSMVLWTWRDFAVGYASLRGQLNWGSFASGIYTTSVGLAINLSSLIGIGLVLYLSLARESLLQRKYFWWLVGLMGFLAVGVLLQQKFFKYHFASALPFAALAAGAGWAQLWRLATGRQVRYALAFLCAFAAAYFMRYPVTDLRGTPSERSLLRAKRLFGFGKSKRSQAAYEALYVIRKDFNLPNTKAVAAWISHRLEHNETFLLWGCDSMVYWLAEREPATRYVHNIPQRSKWQAEFARRGFMKDVQQRKPKVVVVQRGDSIGPVTGEREDSAEALPRFAEFDAYLKSGYKLTTTIGSYDIYAR